MSITQSIHQPPEQAETQTQLFPIPSHWAPGRTSPATQVPGCSEVGNLTQRRPVPEGLYVGMEVEVPRAGYAAAQALQEVDALSTSAELHSYHCRCEACDPERSGEAYWAGQRDCTVSAEFVSKILHDDVEITNAIRTIERAIRTSDGAPQDSYYDSYEYECECGCGEMIYDEDGGEDFGDDAAGCHVHVTDILSGTQALGMYKFFHGYVDAISVLASSHLGQVRDTYYGRPHNNLYVSGKSEMDGWLTFKGRTFEFRIWNYSDEAWRLRIYAHVSRAIVQAARDGRFNDLAEGDFEDLYLTYSEVRGEDHRIYNLLQDLIQELRDYMPKDIPALMERQFNHWAAFNGYSTSNR